ncbi:MAG: hypothetical protein KGN79_05935 [Acidobacteriota bacterium]|nr:hypothetical protein [Acidobacteriota bacterium]
MKIGCSTIALLGLLVAHCVHAQLPKTTPSPSSKPEFSIHVTQPRAPFKLGKPVVINVSITNVTKHDILWESWFSMSKDLPYMSCRFLLERSGKEVETTYFDRYITGRGRPDDPFKVISGSAVLVPKPPGKMFEMNIDLTRLYQITKPGTYTLHISRYDPATKTTVSANTVTIQIER